MPRELHQGRDFSPVALQHHGPCISHVVDVTSQVVLYTLGRWAKKWVKTDVEGALFVYIRSASPSHGFIIINRMQPVTKDLDFLLPDPFLLYRNTRGESEHELCVTVLVVSVAILGS
uniref:5'-(N(7)-methylguanosine 5'-triphospho)-[mRNA] hydrolase n=1 Tax=Catagonus wagneri TaxID=51154 RepID=A0A8C3XCU5_9CETA